jgi:hypothetical protein
MMTEATGMSSILAEVAVFDAFMQDYLDNHMDRLSDLTADAYVDVCEEEDYIAGFWSEDERWRRAADQATERLLDEAQEVWELEGNSPLREYAERLHKRMMEAEVNLAEAVNLNQSMQVRMEAWKTPPICKCGAISYTVECRRCRRTLEWDGWREES